MYYHICNYYVTKCMTDIRIYKELKSNKIKTMKGEQQANNSINKLIKWTNSSEKISNKCPVSMWRDVESLYWLQKQKNVQ